MAHSRHRTQADRPQPISDIVQSAQNFDFGSYRSLKDWLRSAQLLVTEAAICEQDGNLQKAYLYLIRHAELVISKLPTHPEYKDPKWKAEVAKANRATRDNLKKLEEWKPKIVSQWERYVRSLERREEAKGRVARERMEDERERQSFQKIDGEGVQEDDEGVALDASQHKELAIDLAHREIRRRDANRNSTRQAGISPGTVAARRRGMVVNDDGAEYGSVSDAVREAGRLVHRSDQRQSRNLEPGSSYQYPSVPTKERRMDWTAEPLEPIRKPTSSLQPPLRPAKESLDPPPTTHELPGPPLLPRLSSSPPPGAAPTASSRYTFHASASTEGGQPLRPMFIPSQLRRTFLSLASSNTSSNLETCGILCGTLISSALFITHLILPDQHGTSDTCDTTESGDAALFEYADTHNLLVCGWIHTHPSQSCFLSSRDLHTSSGYQVMLPEAVAIVCAPRHEPSWGVFRLTDPPGLPHVLRCEKSGLFHPHDETRVYTDAGGKGGHVVEGEGLRFEVVDLRQNA